MRYSEIIESNVLTLANKPSEAGPADQFIDEFNNATSPHPWDNKKRIHGLTMMHLSRLRKDAIYIHDISAIEPNQGHASKTMKFICSLANKLGVQLELTAKAFGNNRMTTEQLEKWYKKFGFSTIRQDEDSFSMVRFAPTIVKLRGFNRPH